MVAPPPDLADAVLRAAAPLLAIASSAADTSELGGVSPPQLRALLALGRHGSLNLTRLAAHLRSRPPSASRLCDRLVAAGLVDRRPTPHSRREVSLTLTWDGQRLVALVGARQREQLEPLLARLDETSRCQLLAGLLALQAARAEAAASAAGGADSAHLRRAG